jgi:hypothetical protein
VSGGHQTRPFLVIALERLLAGMELPALQLDHEPCLGPVRVDRRRVAVDHDVALIRR